MSPPISKDKLADIIAKARAAKSAIASLSATNSKETIIEVLPAPDNSSLTIDRYGVAISLNDKQLEAVNLAAAGKSLVLIGAAGSGKTTTTRAITAKQIESGMCPIMQETKHKYLTDGTPGIVFVSYTRRAVANLRKALSSELAKNCITIHKLLQYEPVYDTVYDSTTGSESTKMSFQATRNSMNPLPACIRTIVIDESSMVSVELYNEIVAACNHEVQFIFLGDIQQLPPVFGSAILGFKMLELPTIELTEIYRQALESPIIRLAHRILSGQPITKDEFTQVDDIDTKTGPWKVPNQLTIHPWKKKLDADLALLTCAKFFTAAIDSGHYDSENDVILIPFNKSLGTIELNKYIAQHLANQRRAEVYEIIAGFNKYYYSVGDKVLVDKEDAVIVKIERNKAYLGQVPQEASTTLDYWGAEQGDRHHITNDGNLTDDDADALLEAVANGAPEDRVRQCSHIITVRMMDSEAEVKISNASEVNSMLLAYCLTVHKSQGSEWRKVFVVIHQSHATMVQRELLYTAVTRAREELYVICEPDTFMTGIKGQRIKGDTLAEKAEFFQGKLDAGYLER